MYIYLALKIIQPLQNAKQSGVVNKCNVHVSTRALINSQIKFITTCSSDFENVMLSLLLTGQKKNHFPQMTMCKLIQPQSILWRTNLGTEMATKGVITLGMVALYPARV